MTDQEKEEIFKKSMERSERDKLRNKGVEIFVGDETISLKTLVWDEANEFEDAVIKASSGIGDLMGVDLTAIKPNEVLTIISKMLRDDLLELANVATSKKITIEYIRETRATKDDIIKLVAKALEINYGYLKNLIALMRA